LASQAAGQVAEVEAAAADTALVAPLAAEVDKLILHVGELAPAGFPIMTLVDLKDCWATFNIREDDLAGIRVGSEFEGKVPALGGQRVTLKVYYISPKGDFATWRPTRLSGGYDVKTFEVRARPLAPVAGLRPGMSVLVSRAG
jgi:HlyD family secretion protein